MRTSITKLLAQTLAGTALAAGLLAGSGTPTNAQTGFHQHATAITSALAHHYWPTPLRGAASLIRHPTPLRGAASLIRHPTPLRGAASLIRHPNPLRAPSSLIRVSPLGGGTGRIMPLGLNHP
jgi:hypothetical protein